MNQGTLFVVSAPSGAGKTTLVSHLLAAESQINASVSYTTRAPRAGEVDGVAYHFVSIESFKKMQAHGDFLESAEVHGNLYGTSRSWLQEQMRLGQDVLLEIDWQGAQQVRAVFPTAVTIFIMPPSIGELERRLRGRGTDSEAVVQLRINGALDEMRHVSEFDFVIINNDLDTAHGDMLAAVRAAHLRFSHQRANNPEVFSCIEQD
ncbi:MAG: guanylate kinase [Rhodocyclaceae bacterium]|nr:guanylate kinase [Rhodocyclaceae bacterium]